MMLFCFALLLGLLAFAVTGRSRRYHRPAVPVLVAAAYLLPAAFLASTLGWAALREEGFLRFALLGFGFPAEETPRTLGLGGAPSTTPPAKPRSRARRARSGPAG